MKYLWFALALSLSGCSSIPLDSSGGDMVPPSRVFDAASVGPAGTSTDGTIVVLRDWGFLGGGCKHTVYLDAKKLFEIGGNERMEFHATAGHHLLRVQDATLLCPGSTTSLETDLVPGSRQVYRIQLSGNQQVNFARIE